MNLTLMQILRKIFFNKNTTQLLLFAGGILVFGIVGGYFYFQKATAPRVIEICESGKRPVSVALA